MKHLQVITLFLFLLAATLVVTGCKADADDACTGIICSGHGTCSTSNGEATCACDEGYHPDGLNCLLGNADAQDSDSSSDAEDDDLEVENPDSSDTETGDMEAEDTDSAETTDVSDSSDGEVSEGSVVFGEDCEENQVCISSICTMIPELEMGRCTDLCDDNCLEGWSCDLDANTESEDRVCLPDPCSDEGTSRSCYSGLPETDGVGICQPGEQQCDQGFWRGCTGQQLPEPEGSGVNCSNNLDDDCDDLTDTAEEDCGCMPEDPPLVCYEGPPDTQGVGICQAGEQECLGNNQWEEDCDGQVIPQEEYCSNMGSDDNCDGVDDNIAGFGDDCNTGLSGICAPGTMQCDGEHLVCTPNLEPGEEICDGLDNNCDGTPDENCPCVYNENDNPTRGCYSGLIGTEGFGICHEGTQECDPDNFWGSCIGEQLPEDEICDGADNDCDADTDEDLGETTCGQGPCEHSVLNCLNGITQECDAFEGSGDELCDGIDNDCDGETDEDFDLNTDPDNCGECGNECPDNGLCISGICQPPLQDTGSCSNTYCVHNGSFVNFSSNFLESESYRGSSSGGQILTVGEMSNSRYKMFIGFPQ